MRYALYFAPGPSSALAQLAAGWLGRDAATGRTVPFPAFECLPPEELAAITSSARRYGFHGTLKAPFRLADGATEQGLLGELTRFAAGQAAFELPGLVVGRLGRFLALVPERRSEPLQAFAGNVVRAFDEYRAPPTQSEIERRDPSSLSLAERDNLERWGYPYVFDCFRFHMTLTNQLPDGDLDRIAEAARKYFSPALGRPVPIDAVTLFVEAEPGAPFEVHSRIPLAGGQQRKTI